MSRRFAFIRPIPPTDYHVAEALKHDIEIVYVGDRDPDLATLCEFDNYDGIITQDPELVALYLPFYHVGVFRKNSSNLCIYSNMGREF